MSVPPGIGSRPVFTGTVYAATVDDLREIVGTGRLDTPENRALLSRIVYMYSNQQHNQQLMDTINDSVNIHFR